MKKNVLSRTVCFLLVLLMLLQNLAITVYANDDMAEDYCPASENGQHNRVGYETIPATCITPELKGGSYCSACLKEFSPRESTGIYADHTEETIPGKDATCTETGLSEGVKCSVCNKILVEQDQIPAKGHARLNRTEKAPTCTEAGWKAGWLCENGCGYKEGLEEIPATGHTRVTVAAVPATCTTPGKTEGERCSVCSKILKAQKQIPAKEHYVVLFPGYAPTCGEIGKENGLRCFTCGAVLEPRPEIPATGIHQFVPAGSNPNDGFTCQICGKSYSGLTRCDALPLLPYEKEDSANGFRLSQGEASAKSAQLQIYRNEEGNYVNVICLTWEDGTVTYVSFESGTANIGELLTIYLQNAKDAATREKLEDASQPNFGIGFDESGNPYLYVVKDGTKYAFMVSTPAPETVEIVFGTKDLTTTEENQQIQQFEEQKEEQTITKFEEDTTDNTFVIHKFVEPEEEEEEEEVEVIIPNPNIGEKSIGFDFDKLSNCKGHKWIRYSDYLHECTRCKSLVFHKYQNSVCVICNGECKHSRWYASLENCICYGCGATKEHNFVEKESGCECADCGVYYTHHSQDGVNNSCSHCGHIHSWTEVNGRLVCQTCQAKEIHQWKQMTNYCECGICGKRLAHKYEDGLCSRCGYQCSHSWRDRNGVNICYDCQMTEVHDWQERDGGCWCTNCGKTQSHEYENGSCVNCEYKCTHPDGMPDDTCPACGFTCSHNYGWQKKNSNVCVCKKCRMEEAHHWIRFGKYHLCSKCGAFSLTKKS